ncbi:MAG: CvpA family protein [Actinomycetes bacterium]
MNALDVTVLALALLGAVVGASLGLVRGLAVWCGTALGAIGATALLPAVSDRSGSSSSGAVLAPMLLVVGLMAGGGLLGAAVRRSLRRDGSPRDPGRIDRSLGSAVGAFAVLLGVWLLLPVVSAARTWPPELSSGSLTVRGIDRFAPGPPAAVVEAARRVAAANPGAHAPLDPGADVGAPPTVSDLDPAAVARALRSSVRIEGRACATLQDGSGVVIGRDLVLTNAHVVAGERSTAVVRPDGSAVPARVVAFDGRADAAVLRVPGLGLPALPQGTTDIGRIVATIGHPGGGPVRVAPTRIAERIRARGTDILGRGRTRRAVLVLAAELEPGDSGSPLVDAQGRVVGLAFAIDPDAPRTAYALEPSEYRELVAGAGTQPVSTGACVTR